MDVECKILTFRTLSCGEGLQYVLHCKSFRNISILSVLKNQQVVYYTVGVKDNIFCIVKVSKDYNVTRRMVNSFIYFFMACPYFIFMGSLDFLLLHTLALNHYN